MRTATAIALTSCFGVCVLAQQVKPPQLKLQIITQKDTYALNERVIVQSELTNLSSKTLCFPVPDQRCESAGTGWILTMGEPASAGDYGWFLCHADGRGASRAELESEISHRWIKLPPNAVYLMKAAEAYATLDQSGDWRLTASYHPPVGAFNRDYVKTLQSAAESTGCTLPESSADAEPKIISVLPTTSAER